MRFEDYVVPHWVNKLTNSRWVVSVLSQNVVLFLSARRIDNRFSIVIYPNPTKIAKFQLRKVDVSFGTSCTTFYCVQCRLDDMPYSAASQKRRRTLTRILLIWTLFQASYHRGRTPTGSFSWQFHHKRSQLGTWMHYWCVGYFKWIITALKRKILCKGALELNSINCCLTSSLWKWT